MIKTTEDLIKFLPFEEEFRKTLLDAFPNLSGEQKYNIGIMLWQAYDVLFEIKLEKNLVIAFEEAENDREKLDKDFHKRVEELTENEMEYLSAEDIKEAGLDITRQKLAEIMSSKN